jgi:DNA primase
MRRFNKNELYKIRNQIPIREVIEDILAIPSKDVEGVFRFVCPCCYESKTAVNPKTNLSRCFRCEKNFNTIDIVMADRKLSFVAAVAYLVGHYQTMLQSATAAQSDPGFSIYAAS